MMWITIKDSWQINKNGQIRHIKNKIILRLRLRQDKYVDVKLSYKRYLVHRLMAEAFIPNPRNLPQVNHIDGNRQNFNLDNLEWCDQRSNMQHAITIGLFPNRKGEKNGRATITQELAYAIMDCLSQKEHTILEIAKIFNTSYNVVANIKYKRAWKIVC